MAANRGTAGGNQFALALAGKHDRLGDGHTPGAAGRRRPCTGSSPDTKTGARTASAKGQLAPSSGRPMAEAAAAAQDSVTPAPSMSAEHVPDGAQHAAVNSMHEKNGEAGGNHEVPQRAGRSGKRPARPQPGHALHPSEACRAAAAACGSNPGFGVASTNQRVASSLPSNPEGRPSSPGAAALDLNSIAADAASNRLPAPAGSAPAPPPCRSR